MECTALGLIAKFKGRLTHSHYKYMTVFIDYYSQLGFVYLQKTTGGVETLEAKISWKAYCDNHDIKVLHYHADNGKFYENMFMNNVKEKRKTIGFCRVSAHHQNGIAEKNTYKI